jgi:hypothetical protein
MARRASPGGWLTDNEEHPRADTLSGRRFRRRARFYRVYLLAAAALAPVLLLALAAAVSGSPAVTPAAPPATDSPGRAAATEAMLDWLSAPNPGLVDGRLLLWSGTRTLDPPIAESTATAGDPALTVEVHSFVLVDGAGNRFTAEFQVALGGQGGARVLSGPSLTPLPVLDPDLTRTAGPWPGRPSAPAPEPVVAAVRAWAAAYTSGDPAALRLTVGDPDPARSYLPLTGVAEAATTVGACTALDAATTAVRVDLAITWSAGTPTATAVPAAAASRPVAFDVLVTGADTAAPRVVAWGGPGTGPALVPFGNAVTAVDTPRPTAPAAVVPTAVPPPPVTWEPPTSGHGPAG